MIKKRITVFQFQLFLELGKTVTRYKFKRKFYIKVR